MVVLYCYSQILSCFVFIICMSNSKPILLLWYWFVPNRMTPFTRDCIALYNELMSCLPLFLGILCFKLVLWVLAIHLFIAYTITVIKTRSDIVTFSQTNKKRIDILSENTGCHKQFLIIVISDFMDNNCSHPHLSNSHAYLT